MMHEDEHGLVDDEHAGRMRSVVSSRASIMLSFLTTVGYLIKVRLEKKQESRSAPGSDHILYKPE